MAETTIQDYGLGTLEEGNSVLDYRDYWAAFKAVHLPLRRGVDYPRTDARQYDYAGQFIHDISDIVINGDGDFAAIRDVPDWIWNGTSYSYRQVLSAYDEKLGNFNRMAGPAQADLLKAASLLLQEGAQPKDGRHLTAASLGSTLRRYPVGVQPAEGGTLLAAQFVHKAAWLEPVLGRQTNMFKVAEALYDRSTQSRLAGVSDRASKHMLDCQFHNAYQLHRTAHQNSDRVGQQRAVNMLGSLVHDEAARLIQFYRANVKDKKSGKRPDHSPHRGFLFEAFVPLIIHDAMVGGAVKAGSSGEADVFEVRRAFWHEDATPLPKMRPRPAFDLVVQRYADEGITTLPVQLKHSVANNQSPKRSSKLRKISDENTEAGGYMPGITVVRGEGISVVGMYKAAEELLYKYQGQIDRRTLRKSSNELQQMRQVVVDGLITVDYESVG